MITNLFNQQFTIQRNYPESTNGIIENHFVEVGNVYGRISSPQYNERNAYQNRGMILTAVIYLDVYEYDEQRDVLVEVATGDKFNIKGLSAIRNGDGVVVYLKIPVTESQLISSGSGSSES
jgi:tRNA A37 threonylcarbamoyladenosine biosynthesis protein TsaE